MSRFNLCDVNSLYDKNQNLDVFEDYFYQLFLTFNPIEKSCNKNSVLSKTCVVTSGDLSSFNAEQYTKPFYRKSMFGDTLCTSWTNWVNGKISAPSSSIGQLIRTPNNNSEKGVNAPKEKLACFSKNLDKSLPQKFENQSAKPRAIRGGNLSQDKIDNSPTKLQILENNSLNKYQPRYQPPKTTNKLNPRDLTCPPKCCKFCFNNGEPEIVYASHMAKFVDGTVSCPILRRYVCELCGATGSYSHTRKYCPLYGNILHRSQKLAKLI